MGLAAQGLRDIGDGAEKIGNLDELARVKAQGRRVFRYASISAIVATGIFVLIR